MNYCKAGRFHCAADALAVGDEEEDMKKHFWW